MEARELRVGNWIEKEGKIYQITALGIFCCGEKHKPIPLTEEWLLKMGFKFSWMSGQCLIQLPIKYDLRFVRPYKDNNEGEQELDLRNGSISLNTKIKHVHQLQNLYFALTNTELEIK